MTNLNSFENFSAETSIKSKHLESLGKIKHRKSSFDGRKNCETVDKVSLSKKKRNWEYQKSLTSLLEIPQNQDQFPITDCSGVNAITGVFGENCSHEISFERYTGIFNTVL